MPRPRTPIASGDPVWVSVDGEEQARPGILVRWASDEPMKGNGVVQLVDQAAGSHQIYPAEQLHYRRDGSHPSDIRPHRASESPPRTGPPPPTAAASPPTDPHDQLIDAMGRVADKIESLIKDSASEVAMARRRLKKRGEQLRRIRAAVRLLRGEWRKPGPKARP